MLLDDIQAQILNQIVAHWGERIFIQSVDRVGQQSKIQQRKYSLLTRLLNRNNTDHFDHVKTRNT
jgi:hypothetical protein